MTDGSTAQTRWLAVATVSSIAMGVGVNSIDVPGSMVWFQRHTGGLGTLDTQPLAGAVVVHELLSRLGSEGRALYLREIVVFDIVFPIVLLAMVHLALLRVWSLSTARRLLVLPWAAFVVDLIENSCAAVLTITFPVELTPLANAIGWITAAKFALYAAGFVAVAAGLVARLVTRAPR